MTVTGHSDQFSPAVLQARQRFRNRIDAALPPGQTFVGGAEDSFVGQGEDLIPEGYELHKFPAKRSAETTDPSATSVFRKFDPVTVEIDSDQLACE
jgi:hypothetical protein